MRRLSSVLSVLFSALGTAAVASSACSENGSGLPEAHDAAAPGGTTTGGNPGSGGSSPTGGTVGSGGTQGSSRSSAASGGSGSGGTTRTGGTATTGGATGAGGRTSAGGSTGRDGATGGGGDTDAGSAAEDAGKVPTDAAPSDAGVAPKDVAAVEVADTAPQTCPAGQAAPTAGNKKTTLQHEGRSRTYTLHVPSALPAGKPLAVVFDLHGAGGNGSQQQGMSGWAAVADREGFLAVFPDGVDGYWNVDDKCCGTAGQDQIDDVGFIRAIIEKLRTDICIDAKRIYASGFSNGGGLTHRMGCDAADVIAAIAPVDTDLRTQPCNAARPIAMMEVRGMSDSLEPYEGGVVGPPGGQYVSPGAQGSLELWADINQCPGAPSTIEQYCESYTECGDGVETNLCSLPGVDHKSYNNPLDFDIASVAWRMFQRQPMR